MIHQWKRYYIESKAKNNSQSSEEIISDGDIPEMPYEYNTAGAYSLEIPASGYYEIECWGAQGGASYSSTVHGGYGGYSRGIV